MSSTEQAPTPEADPPTPTRALRWATPEAIAVISVATTLILGVGGFIFADRQAERGFREADRTELREVLDSASIAMAALNLDMYRIPVPAKETAKFAAAFKAKADELSTTCARLSIRAREPDAWIICTDAAQEAQKVALTLPADAEMLRTGGTFENAVVDFGEAKSNFVGAAYLLAEGGR